MKKIPNQFTTKFLMLLLLVAFASCDKDFDEALKDDIVTTNETSRFHVRTGEDVSQKAVSFLKERTNNTLKVSLGKKSVMLSRSNDASRESAMGTVDTSKEIAVDNEYNTKHTFNIIDDGDPNTVINVIVVETADVTYEYFKKYTFQNGLPLNSDKTINLNLFKGVIETYNSAGELTGALLVIDGEVVDSGGNNDPCPDDDGIWDGWDDFWEQLNNGTSSSGNGGVNTDDGANTSTGNTQGGEYVDPVDEEGCTVYEVNITCEICQGELVGATHFTSGEHINDSDFLVVRCGNYVVTTAQRNGNYASRDAEDEDPCGEGDTGVLIDDYEPFSSDCDLLQDLLNSPDFTTRMQELFAQTTGNTEVGYFGSTDANGVTTYPSSDRVEGVPDEAEIIISVPSTTTVDSFIHNHFNNGSGTFSVFSGSDLYTAYQLYINGNLGDLDNFVMVVTTPGSNIASTEDDTVYAITINSETDFAAFGSKFLTDPLLIDSIFYDDPNNLISTNISTALQEERFVRMLQNNESGLTVYRGDKDDLGNWTRLKIRDDNTLKENNCN